MTEFEENRKERRSFYCSNELWNKMVKATNNCYSVSDFIVQAIEEKLRKK